MEGLVAIVNQFYEELEIFYYSPTFMMIKFIIGIYVIVLVIDIVLMLFQRNLIGDLLVTLRGVDIPLSLTSQKSGLRKKWKSFQKDLESGQESKYKITIIKADELVTGLLKGMRYKGNNLSEILDNIPPGDLEHIDDLREAHQIKNKIVQDDNFVLDQKTAKETLALYEEFLGYFNIFG